ncbi:MAG: hypothetical protein HXY38_11585 [Chloroflexi bacterium]|nr:hypothetical protein [Chloroflexota bacterium]
MELLLIIHSHTRWLILLVAVIAIVKFAIGWLRGGVFKGMDRGLAAGFSGLMDLQVTIGLIFLIWSSLVGVLFTPNRIEHLTTMLIAAVVAHLPARWKNSPDNVRFRNALFCVVGSLALVFVGVVRLRGGWTW